MNATCFVDTNVFVYARDAGETGKQPLAEAWLKALWRQRRGRLSYQVLHEYYVTVTRKLRPGISMKDARDDVRALELGDELPVEYEEEHERKDHVHDGPG